MVCPIQYKIFAKHRLLHTLQNSIRADSVALLFTLKLSKPTFLCTESRFIMRQIEIIWYRNNVFSFLIVLPAVLGFAVAGFIIATAFYVCRLRHRSSKKSHEPAIYQPKKRTTAVRSPSGQMGQPPHYLKKSPSPTSVTKPLPGGSLSPTTETSGGQLLSTNLRTQSIIAHPKYTEENEIQTKIIGQMENSTSSIGSDGNDGQEYGKLGSLVFKLRYLTDRNAFVVSVIRCRGLPYKNIVDDLPNGTNGKKQTATDPYVKLQLLPDKQHKVKTRYDKENIV